MIVVTLNRVHMYCLELCYKDEHGSFSMIVEETPKDGELMPWECDIPGDHKRRSEVIRLLPEALAKVTCNRMLVVEGTRL